MIPFDGFSPLRDASGDFETSGQRAFMVTGAGEEFCVGADLDRNGRLDLASVADAHRRMKVVDAAATALHRITKPSIAAVDGVAVGAGMSPALVVTW